MSEAFGHGSYVLLILGFFTCGFHVAFITTHLPPYLVDKGLDAKWGGWVIDGSTGVSTFLGSVLASPQLQKLYPISVTDMAWSGPRTGDCATYPLAESLVFPAYGYSAGAAWVSSNLQVAASSGDCPTTTVNGPGWAFYAVGTSA